jgi:hypothetical protein
MRIAFDHCDQRQSVDPLAVSGASGHLCCQICQAAITSVDVSDFSEWIEQQVAHKRELAQRGQLGTRKQATARSDEEIDRDGLSAELAACSLLCPGSLTAWQNAAERQKNNRGRDLLRTWTRLNRAVEVKHTRYHDDQRGFLLIRPPRRTRGRMKPEYIDNSYYVLMVGQPYDQAAVGWTDREGLLREGQLNPVPVRSGQRESWGMHWSKLRPIVELVERIGLGGRLGALRRWFADALC